MCEFPRRFRSAHFLKNCAVLAGLLFAETLNLVVFLLFAFAITVVVS